MKQYLYDEYWNNEKSTIKIGNELGVDRRTLVDWMRLLNLKRRGNTELICRNNSKILPTYEQIQILLGSWMGDGSYRKTSKNTFFRLTHSQKQYDYLLYKKNKLEQNNFLKFSEYFRKQNSTFSIESQSHSFLNNIYASCQTNGRANFNRKYLWDIDDYGLYIWYLDDGCLQHNAYVVLCTDKFSYDENLEIQDYFLNKYNIRSRIQKVKRTDYYHFRIRFNQEDSLKFISVINKYYDDVPCLQYKLNIKGGLHG